MNTVRLIAALFLLFPMSGPAAVRAVPSQYSTIQAAVSAARPGDSVIVATGVYTERVSVSGNGITVQGTNARVLGFDISGSGNTVRGFETVSAAHNNGFQVTGNFNAIEGNDIHGTKQDGVWFFGTGNTFRDNYIHDILDPSISGDPHVDCFQTWVWNWPTVDTLIDGNLCDHTRTTGSNQIAMLGGAIRTTISNNIFVMHDAGYSPLSASDAVGVEIERNTFVNTTGLGSPAIYGTGSDVSIVQNVVIGYSSVSDISGASVSGNFTP